MRFLEAEKGLEFASYAELWTWSATDIEAFWEPHEKAGVAQALACAVVGSRDTVRRGIADFVQRHRPDEIMLTANIFDHAKRLRSFEIAADVLRNP